MRGYLVADVRSAESMLLAATAEGALMQRAATALAVACARTLRSSGSGRVTSRHVVLLVGPGNNGGDALWAGARLRARGAAVTALLTSPKPHPEGLAALLRAGGSVIDTTLDGGASLRPAGGARLERVLTTADLFVDGLLGLGGRPGLRPGPAALVRALPAGVPVIAVDLPSGIDPDTGELPGPGAGVGAHPGAGSSVRADLTVTFGAVKPGLLLPPASATAGAIELVDLGFGPYLPAEPLVERLTASDLARLWPVPEPGADKYRRGVLGMVTGSAGYPGAAVLAAGGALRAGVGMVRYVGPPDAAAAVRAAWPEVVVGAGRVQAWALGSGVPSDPDSDRPASDRPDGDQSDRDQSAGASSEGDGQRAAIRRAIESGLPCLLDAGAIDLLPPLPAGTTDRSEDFLLTPHAGELARLLGVDRAEVERRPHHHALAAARRTGATVLLKGSTTLVVRPDGRTRSQAEAPAWLATAGAGDTLAGIAGALLAAGLPPFDAGAVAASIHGRAATRACGATSSTHPLSLTTRSSTTRSSTTRSSTHPRASTTRSSTAGSSTTYGGPITATDVANHLPSAIATLLTRRPAAG